MLRKLTAYAEVEPRKLMALYAEGNEENIDYFYPGAADRKQALEKVEAGFLNYLETEFFPCPGNACWILEEDGVWISALRLYSLGEGLYYLEALETRPDRRRMGFATRLLSGVIGELKKQGAFRLCDCVGKKNAASLRTHEKCGFQRVSDAGYDYLQNEADDGCYGLEYAFVP